MLTPDSPKSRQSIAQLRQSGFSLVEVVLAVGVISFAFVAILGLLPAGLHQFRQAMDTSVAAQIAQRIVQDDQQTDFDTLTEVTPQTGSRLATSTQAFTALVYSAPGNGRSVRYFDEQGNEVVPVSSSPSPTEIADIVYTVNTRIQPWPLLPGVTQPDTTASTIGHSMATVTIQVVYNPSAKTLTLNQNQGSSNYLLVDTTNTQMKSLSIRTFSAQVGRND